MPLLSKLGFLLAPVPLALFQHNASNADMASYTWYCLLAGLHVCMLVRLSVSLMACLPGCP